MTEIRSQESCKEEKRELKEELQALRSAARPVSLSTGATTTVHGATQLDGQVQNPMTSEITPALAHAREIQEMTRQLQEMQEQMQTQQIQQQAQQTEQIQQMIENMHIDSVASAAAPGSTGPTSCCVLQ
jgi:predicted sugar kinase